jgi:inner membrane protein
MTGKTHMVAGAVAVAGYVYLLAPHVSVTVALPLLAVGAAAALLPDIDHPMSKLSKSGPILGVLAWFYRLLLRTISFVLRLPIWLCGKFGIKLPPLSAGHRGPMTHGLLGFGIFALLLSPFTLYGALGVQLYVAALLGVLSHLFMDMLNPQGVPLLYPIVPRHLRLLPIGIAPTTGTWRETGLRWAMTLGLLLLVYQTFLPTLTKLGRIGGISV